jgi:predicted nuclease of predicted toxin-antitoxin system
MADIRFYADQHYPAPVTSGLLRRGIDVTTAQEMGLCGETDYDQLAFAMSQGRVMLTFDSDFLNLHRSGLKHAGIVWCPATKHSIGELIRKIVILHSARSAEDMVNRVEYL